MPRPKGSKNKATVAAPAPKKARKPVVVAEDLYADEDEEAPVVAAPKKRGRPPGTKNKVVAAPVAAPAKRGPGRPKKVVEPIVEEEEEEDYEEEEEIEEEEDTEEEEAADPFDTVEEDEEEGAEDFFGTAASDDTFSEDFTGETAGTRLAAEGAHRVKCTKIEKSKSKAGDDMYVWDFVVVGGSGNGISLKLYTALSPAARWKVIETLEALGIEASNRVVSFKASDVVGVKAIALVVHDTYNNQLRNNISKLMTENDAAEAGIELVG